MFSVQMRALGIPSYVCIVEYDFHNFFFFSSDLGSEYIDMQPGAKLESWCRETDVNMGCYD